MKQQHVKLVYEIETQAEFDEKMSYKNPKREEARQLRLQKLKKQQLEIKEKKEKEESLAQDQKPLKNEEEKVDDFHKTLHQKKKELLEVGLTKKRQRRAFKYLEEEDMKKQAKLLKLVKKHKISEEEYEELSGEKDFILNNTAEPQKKNYLANKDDRKRKHGETDDDDVVNEQPDKKKRKKNK